MCLLFIKVLCTLVHIKEAHADLQFRIPSLVILKLPIKVLKEGEIKTASGDHLFYLSLLIPLIHFLESEPK